MGIIMVLGGIFMLVFGLHTGTFEASEVQTSGILLKNVVCPIGGLLILLGAIIIIGSNFHVEKKSK